MKKYIFLLFSVIIFLLSSCTSKQEKVEKYMKAGIKMMEASDNKPAIEDFTRVIELSPENYEAYYYRANARFNLKQAQAALIDYNKAIVLKPNYKEAFSNRGYCKQYLKDFDGACSDWKKAIALGMHNLGDNLNICK